MRAPSTATPRAQYNSNCRSGLRAAQSSTADATQSATAKRVPARSSPRVLGEDNPAHMAINPVPARIDDQWTHFTTPMISQPPDETCDRLLQLVTLKCHPYSH